LWAYAEQSGTSVLSGGGTFDAISATVESESGFSVGATEHVTGLTLDSSINGSATINASANFTGLYIKSNGKDWFNGIWTTGCANDWKLRNGATIDNTSADLLTITEATTAFSGALTTGTSGGTSGQVNFVASDNDQGSVTISTDDELLFTNFSGGISVGVPLKIGAADYTIDIAGVTFNSNLLSNSESLTDLTSVWQSNTDNPIVSGNMIFARSRDTEASPDPVIDGDELGMIIFCGHDGTDYNFSSAIEAVVDETTVAADEMGGALKFSTCLEGTNTLVERLRIENDGDIRISKTSNAGIVNTTSIGELQFWGNDDTGDADEIAGQIEVIGTGTWTDGAEDAKMVLNAANDGVLNTDQLVLNTDGSISASGNLTTSGHLTMLTYKDDDIDDNDTYNLPDGVQGHGIVFISNDTNEEGGTFGFFDDNPCLISVSANCQEADADNKLVIMDGGDTVQIKNTLGDNYKLTLTIWYYTP